VSDECASVIACAAQALLFRRTTLSVFQQTRVLFANCKRLSD
jgi:hypothetical protein